MITQTTVYQCDRCPARTEVTARVDAYDDPVIDLPSRWDIVENDLLCPACMKSEPRKSCSRPCSPSDMDADGNCKCDRERLEPTA